MKKIIFLFRLVFFICFFSKISIAQNPIVQNIINDVRIDSLTKFIKELSGQTEATVNGNLVTISSRHRESPGNELAYQYIKQKLISYGLQIDTMQFNGTGKNIWAILPGTVHPERKCIIGAHYDDEPPFPNHFFAPGADDNASGTAAVIEAARIFSKYGFENTILFVLWDEEEQGLIGSFYWTLDAKTNNDSILAYINLDMIGWDGNSDNVAMIQTKAIAQSIQLADTALQCNSKYGIDLDSIILLNPGNNSSDHASFWNKNFSAISICEDHENDFNIYYHSEADSIGQLNLSFYQKVVKLSHATLGTIAVANKNAGISISEICIYPNPSIGYFTITIPNKAIIEIFNIQGQLIKQIYTDENLSHINISDFESGMYLVKVKMGDAIFIKKLIKQ